MSEAMPIGYIPDYTDYIIRNERKAKMQKKLEAKELIMCDKKTR